MDSASDSIKQSIPNRYSLVVLAAKRAKQIREGAPLLIDTDSPNSLTVALEEIAAGKIQVIEAVEPPPRVAAAAPAAAFNGASPSAMEMLDASLTEAARAARPDAVEGMAGLSDDSEEADEDNGEQDDSDAEAEQDGYAGASTSAAEEE